MSSTAHYTVLARRYRPQTFDEVVGQQHVATALKNAIQAGRVAHAYLFTGARGVGKTSMARILAKALNCQQQTNGIPCNECDICEGIAAGRDVDVLEIDGASNRGIDDIRQLRANVNVKSMRTQFKMYIIDEVHMLTKEAFNALLKTLEEPPPNVKFVFCTTEPNKVPDTILSRVQRFDFASIETHRIAERLASIAEQEGMKVDAAAVDLVARRAGGSMRDSQSLFDQLLAFSEDQITVEDVNRLLGTAGDERLIQLVECLIQRDGSKVFQEIDSALREGVQLVSFADQLLNYFRDLLAIATGAEEISLMSVQENSREILKTQATTWGLRTIAAAMQILSDTRGRMIRVANGRPLVELALVRITTLEDLESLKGIVETLRNGQPVQVAGRTLTQKKTELKSHIPASLPQKQPEVKSKESHKQEAPSNLEPPKEESPKVKTPKEEVAKEVVEEKAPIEQSPVSSYSSDEMPLEAMVAPSDLVEENPRLSKSPNPSNGIPAVKIPFEPEKISAVWSQSLTLMEDNVKGQLGGVSSVAISGPNRLDVIYPSNYTFSVEYFEKKPELVSQIEEALEATTDKPIRVTFRVDLNETKESQNSNSSNESNPVQDQARVTKLADKDPYVQSVLDLFGARTVSVAPLNRPKEEPQQTDQG